MNKLPHVVLLLIVPPAIFISGAFVAISLALSGYEGGLVSLTMVFSAALAIAYASYSIRNLVKPDESEVQTLGLGTQRQRESGRKPK
jgi:hypothetical protein